MISCTFENGNKTSLRHVTVTAILLNEKLDSVIMVKRAPFLTNPGKYCFPGGYLDRDETPEEAVLREIYEETGYEAELQHLMYINTNPQGPKEDRQNVDFLYIAIATKKTGKSDHESSDVKWFSFDAVPEEPEFAFDHYDYLHKYLENKNNPNSFPMIFSRKTSEGEITKYSQ